MMKTSIVILILFFISHSIFSQDTKAIDELFGINGIKLESNISDISNIKIIHEDGKIKYALITDEDMHLGTSELYEFTYGFYEDKLAFIMIKTIGQNNSQQFLGKVNEIYGTGHQSNAYIIKYTWFGKLAGMLYEYSEITQSSDLILYSKKLYNLTKIN